MPLIDQRILIDAPPQMIWDFISDPDKLTRWHAGYSGVSVLTTQRMGAGTRRRCAPAGGGKDVIEEIITWIDGLGYEYILIEGGPYRTLQGRLRLQPGPDGTTVQWTITYRPKGLFGLIQDQLSGRRKLTQMMADSLRRLRRQVDALGVRMDETQRAKTGIQGRLDANARAQYQRRYAPPPGLELAAAPNEAIPEEVAEPNISDIQPPAPLPAEPEVLAGEVPSFVADLAGETNHKADTQPRPPEGLREAIAAQQAAEAQAVADTHPTPPERIEPPPAASVPEPPVLRAEPDHKRTTPPHGIPVVRPSFDAEQSASEAPTEPKPPREKAEPSEIAPAERPPSLPPQTPIHDTGEISIWEVFGVKRPSEQDNETLEDLIRSVRGKKSESKRRVGRHIPKRPLRARRIKTVVGLRVWLALRAARIRLNEALYKDVD